MVTLSSDGMQFADDNDGSPGRPLRRGSASAAPAKLCVALAGNPNCGKTSLFNALTGAKQHVGNYPGITVERRTGSLNVGATQVSLHDLPGTYSLSSYSPEERVAQDELLSLQHQVVVLVADSTNLRRSLVLLGQIMQTGARMVLCLNMADEARAAGQVLDVAHMQTLLGMPVVETEGHRGVGIEALRAAIIEASTGTPPRDRLVLGERLEAAVAEISNALAGSSYEARTAPWIATKLLVNDTHFASPQAVAENGAEAALGTAESWRRKIEQDTGQDIALFVTQRYFGFANGLLREVQTTAPRPNARATSDRIDAVLVHPHFGLPIFAAVMFAIFWLTFAVGEIPMGWIESGFGALAEWLNEKWPADSVLRSLLVDGIIGGVGGVIVFLPNILLLFLGLAFLEDTGYLARAAFLMDQVMHRFGLHGKSFIPMLTGFGCSIPGIMATRTLENERDRLTTMLVLPLMSCGARLPIWLLLVPAFFAPAWRAPMLWLIYSAGIFVALALALLLRRSVLGGEEAPFVMELPPYRLPTIRAAVGKMSERAWIYVRKAGTIILSISILMWFLSAYPKLDHYAIDGEIAQGKIHVVGVQIPAEASAEAAAALSAEAIEQARATAPAGARLMTATDADNQRATEELRHSFAGRLDRAIEPILLPLGFDWKLGTAMLGAFAAKEVFVSQLGIVYSLGGAEEGSDSLRQALARDYDPLTAFGLMLFLLIATPCMATVAVTRRESGSWKWALLQFGGLTLVAYVLALVVHVVGGWIAIGLA